MSVELWRCTNWDGGGKCERAEYEELLVRLAKAVLAAHIIAPSKRQLQRANGYRKAAAQTWISEFRRCTWEELAAIFEEVADAMLAIEEAKSE